MPVHAAPRGSEAILRRNRENVGVGGKAMGKYNPNRDRERMRVWMRDERQKNREGYNSLTVTQYRKIRADQALICSAPEIIDAVYASGEAQLAPK